MRIFLAMMCSATLTAYGAAGLLLRNMAGGNPGVEQRLCRYFYYCEDEIPREEIHRRLWSGDRELEASAIALSRELLSRSPASAERWCTLGDAHLGSGEIGRARYAYAQALLRGPSSPVVLMRAANFEWQHGNTSGYLRHTRRVLALVPDYDAAIFDGYRRVGADVGAVIGEELAEDREIASRYAAYLRSRGDADGTAAPR